MGHNKSSKRSMLILVAIFVGIACVFMAAGAYFAYDTLRKADHRAVESRFALAVGRVVLSAERAASYGIALPAQATLAELLVREAALEPEIRSFDVADGQGRVLFSSEPARIGQGLRAAVGADARVDGLQRIARAIRDDLGHSVGTAEVRIDDSAQQASAQRMASALAERAWPALALAALITLLGGLGLVRYTLGAGPAEAGGERPRRRLVFGFGGSLSLLTSFALCVSLTLFGVQAQRLGEREITPDFADKAKSVARASAALVDLALESGIPLEQLTGVAAHFDGVRAASPEIASLELRDSGGRMLQSVGLDDQDADVPGFSAPVTHGGRQLATVKVTLNDEFIGRELRATMIDIAFLACVSLLIALELMALILGSGAVRELAALEGSAAAKASPTPRTSAAANAVRPAVFLFMLAEELTRPFLPGHARALAHGAGANADLLGSLPLVSFLAVVALCQIPFAALSERLGRREGFALGALVAALGYALCGWADALAWFTFARVLSGAGFALVFVSAQGHVIDSSGAGDRARSLAVFIRAILVAGLCGPPLGGMLSDRWGVAATFLACAGLCLLALFAVAVTLPARTRPAPDADALRWEIGLRHVPAAWRADGVRSLLLGCALPAKLMLGALCFYMVPLELQKSGYSGAAIGRLQMIYPVMMVLCVPFFAALADRLARRSLFVLLGGLLGGACAMLALAGTSLFWIGALLFLLGLGQSMSISAQSAMMADLADSSNQSSAVLGLFRLVERSGSAVGPAAGALLLGAIGFAPAVAAIGAIAIAGNAVYAIVSRRTWVRSQLVS